MQTSSQQFIDLVIKESTTGATKLAAGEIMRLRDGVQEVIEALRAGRDAELCARRLEMLLGLRKRLNDTPRRRKVPMALQAPKPVTRPTARMRRKNAK